MPIYEYQCASCGQFEVTQRITEKSLSRCPNCGKKVRKLISNTSFQLKGTGWYLTDYARKGNGAEADKTSKSSAGDGKADSKSTTTASDKKPSDKKTTSQKSSESSAS
ncbi:MAG: zinc ribbon domain-containing protein [Candidatus Binatia bacterium]|nr:zinc ribbon domain-containing protein [Candidatus Binatia bacterium]